MLEPYTDDSLICIGLQMQQGYVGFFDLEQDTKHKDKYKFVLNSDCFNEWYKKDIAELKEKIGEQQATIEEYKDFCLNLCKFLIQKGFVDEYREKYGKEYKIITKWWNDE